MNSILVGLFLALAVCQVLSTSPTGDAECDGFLTGTVPGDFSVAGGPSVNDPKLVLRECVDQDPSACRSLANRDSGALVTDIRLNRNYILIFDNIDTGYDKFYLADSSGFFVNSVAYTNSEFTIAQGSGGCFKHDLTQIVTGEGTFNVNNTDLIWQATFTPSADPVVFTVVARIPGNDVYVSRSIPMQTQLCSGADAGQNLAGCGAFYEFDVCSPICANGYEADGFFTCTAGGIYVPGGGTGCAKIDPYCTSAPPVNALYNFDSCTNKKVDDTCNTYCNEPSVYNEVGDFTCGANGEWSGGSCDYAGPCDLSDITDEPGVAFPSPSGVSPCTNGLVGETCIIDCLVGYEATVAGGLVTCNAVTSWTPTAQCDLITDFCDIADITGTGVIPGACTTRSILDDSYCNYACSEPGYIAKSARLQCTGGTAIGWNFENFGCETPFPTPAPVPTATPTNFPLPTEVIVPSPPTVPTEPTVNPFFLNQPTTAPDTDEGIYIILGAGGGAALLAVAACVGFSYSRGTSNIIEVNEKGVPQDGHYVDDRFGKVEKIKYNSFEGW